MTFRLCVVQVRSTDDVITDVDMLADQYNIIMDILDELAPVTEFTVRNWAHHPWLDDELWSTRRVVCRFEHQFKRHKTSASHDDWRNMLHDSRKQSHAKAAIYWKNKISSTSSNPRHMWQTVNTLLGDKKTTVPRAFTAAEYHDFTDERSPTSETRRLLPMIQFFTTSRIRSCAHLCRSVWILDDVLADIQIAPSKQCSSDRLPTFAAKGLCYFVGSIYSAQYQHIVIDGTFSIQMKACNCIY